MKLGGLALGAALGGATKNPWLSLLGAIVGGLVGHWFDKNVLPIVPIARSPSKSSMMPRYSSGERNRVPVHQIVITGLMHRRAAASSCISRVNRGLWRAREESNLRPTA